MSENNSENGIAIVEDDFTADELRETGSIDEMLTLIANKYGEPVDTAAQSLGDGYSVLDTRDKKKLVGIKFLCVSWNFAISQRIKGQEFVSVRVLTNNGDRIILNDGSTGIYQQLKDYTKNHNGRRHGLLVHKGLRVSEYDYTDKNTGEVSRVQTYYLDTSYPGDNR